MTSDETVSAPAPTGGAIEEAILGGGCFWCLDAVYQELRGVASVKSGYEGGVTENPTYEQVCTGRTGHAEVVRVRFDPAVLSYDDLLRVFFAIHDPTQMNRQGNDVGTQYRSVVFTMNPGQHERAIAIRDEIAAAGIWDGRLVTEIAPHETFYPAEAYHDRYFEQNPGAGYCRVVVAPKVAKFRRAFQDRLKAA